MKKAKSKTTIRPYSRKTRIKNYIEFSKAMSIISDKNYPYGIDRTSLHFCFWQARSSMPEKQQICYNKHPEVKMMVKESGSDIPCLTISACLGLWTSMGRIDRKNQQAFAFFKSILFLLEAEKLKSERS